MGKLDVGTCLTKLRKKRYKLAYKRALAGQDKYSDTNKKG